MEEEKEESHHQIPSESSEPRAGATAVSSDASSMRDAWIQQARQAHYGHEIVLEPEPFDVRLGQGKANVDNPGNMRLQAVVNANVDRYHARNTRKAEKTEITRQIVHFIKYSDTNSGRFLKYDNLYGCWVALDDEAARLKVSCDLRKARQRQLLRTTQDKPTSSSGSNT